MPDKSPLMTILRLLGMFLPGDYLKTTFYLNVIAKPRRALRTSLHAFYRMDHIYEVLQEFKNNYKGKFSILEFGTANGYAFIKMLYATKYLKMQDRVMVHGFDSFEGLPPVDPGDQNLVADNNFIAGDYRGRYEELEAYCSRRYKNYQIHKGDFGTSIGEEFLSTLKTYLPILVWIDCDYYRSAQTVLERLIPYLPNGCVIYFDDYDNINFGSRFTGEARVVHEINSGRFGDGIELVRDPRLSLDTPRIYRFINYYSPPQFECISRMPRPAVMNPRTNGSPLP
jgi:hypothetical protein